jgi:hypothetical protein
MYTKLAMILSATFFFALAGERNVSGVFAWDMNIGNHADTTLNRPILVEHANEQHPLTNALFSIVLPGAGQYRSERYTKAAVFIVVEAALIAYAIVNDKKGDDKTREYQQYADRHWSPLRYAYWIRDHGVRDYGPTVFNFDSFAIENKNFSGINEWERGPHRSGISHTLPPYGDQQYYELIGKYHQFKYGWDTYPRDGEGIPISDGGIVDALIPQQLKDYAVERGKANDFYYAASFAASALVINHVVSAIDAFLSTKSYNREISTSVGMKQIDGFEGKRLVSELRFSVGL